MTRINLLPSEERAKAAREQGIALAILALVVIVALLGGLYLLSYRQLSPKQEKVDEVNAQVAQQQAMVASLQPYETMQTQSEQMAQTSLQIYNSRVLMSSILEEVSLLIPDNVSLGAMTVTVPATMVAGSAITGGGGGSTASTASSSTDLKLQGNCKDFSQVAEFMTRLGLMPQLQNINLANAAKDKTTGLVTFEIDAGLRPFTTPPPQSVSSGGGQ
jgi:Tfp pilus assembly protein PilN